jgi:hypothetical protein
LANTSSELKTIHLRKLATPGKKYYGDNELIYIGTYDGRLRILDESFDNTNSVVLAQDAVGSILTDTTTIDFTYNSAVPSITADVNNSSITYSKIQSVSASRLLGRATASLGVVEEITLGAGLSFIGTTLNVSGLLSALSPIGSTPNANGATLTGSALNLEPASVLFGGVITTGAQGFAGAKTFNDTTAISNTVGTVNGLNITHTVTSSTANNTGIANSVTHTPSANSNFFGIRNDVTFSGSQTLTDVNQGAVGMRGTMTMSGSSTITNASVFASLVQQTGTSTITNSAGFRARNNTNVGGTLINSFGFRADDQTAGTTLNVGFYGLVSAASTCWNLYMSGTAQNYLAGNLGIGQTTPTAYLHIKAGTATASTAPIKLTAGTILATPEAGVFETNSANQLYYSTSTSSESRGFINVERYVAKTSNYTLTANDWTVDCTSGTFTITLPTAIGITGRTYNIKNSGAGVITINTTSSQTIDTALTQSVISFECFTVQSNGANWIII